MGEKWVEVPPEAGVMQSLRHLGYDADVAVADVIDNSITAGATKISVQFDVEDDPDFVWILDDGTGMSRDELRDAFVLGRKSSTTVRSEHDLGRFGLGLKTASFSQARCLTVVSKKRRSTVAFRLDLDQMEESQSWRIEVLPAKSMDKLPGVAELKSQPKGTLVLWQKLDQLLGDAPIPLRRMAEVADEVRDHLALTFHRYLPGGDQRKSIEMQVNGRPVEGFDPFLSTNPATQVMAEESVMIGGARVMMQAYVLPIPDRYRGDEVGREDLHEKLSANQGFYFYRNARLISHSGWPGINKRKSDAAKHTRIRIDIPNELDGKFGLDVQKRRITPPSDLRPALRRMYEIGTKRSERIIRYRGRRKSSGEIHYLWNCIEDRGAFRYEVNPDHPLVRKTFDGLNRSQVARVNTLMQQLGNYLPAHDIHKRMSLESKKFDTRQEFDEHVRLACDIIPALKLEGASLEMAAETISAYDPFNGLPDVREIVATAFARLGAS